MNGHKRVSQLKWSNNNVAVVQCKYNTAVLILQPDVFLHNIFVTALYAVFSSLSWIEIRFATELDYQGKLTN